MPVAGIAFAIILVLTFAATTLATKNLEAGVAATIGAVIVGLVVLVIVDAANASQERTATRDALEERYGVDIDKDEPSHGTVSFVKGGALYTCEVKGIRTEARLFCDEPPRNELTTN